MAATDGAGADVILDNMGAKYLARNVIGARHGPARGHRDAGRHRAELDLGVLLRKRARSSRPRCGPALLAEKAAIVAAVREHVWPLIEAGAVRPIVHARMPLAQAADAHRLLESSTHIGKVLLTV
jgi:NADPH:quinone reductase-like Zn-dependent oxidoreductase